MKNKLNTLRTALVLGMGISVFFVMKHASAHAPCMAEATVAIGSRILDAGKCEPGKALKLVQGNRSYPLLSNNPYSVEYWEGSYQRALREEVTYLHEIFNRCTLETRFSEKKTEIEIRTVEYAIVNPNLSGTVQASYQLVPMTDGEAQQAMVKAQKECEAFNSP